ncbi:MAG: hypothetical protein M3458_05360 [Acidobacteriota bacterium]|nr:hypothetical protein [Acidobacteriota bacterium]
MSSTFTDTADVPLSSVHLELAESTTSAAFVVRLLCVAGTYLKADVDASAKVLARRNGTADAFVDLSIASINLTPFAGTVQAFDVKVEALNVTSNVEGAFDVRVTRTP